MTVSHDLFARARVRMPGGVNSPVRAFAAVGGEPVFFDRAEGAHMFDVDGKRYIDYIGSWGPMICGHSHPKIIEAVQAAVARGLSFGTPSPGEVTMAEKLCDMIPSLDQVRMCSSGTEAAMSAVRVARAATGRDRIIKFEGCYQRPRGQFSGQGRLGSADPGRADLARRPGRAGRTDPERYLQRPRLGRSPVQAVSGRHRLRGRRAHCRQHELHPARARLSSGLARPV